MPSVFSRIVAGEIPCNKIYEDDKTLAFLDIHPLAEGHTLVVFKDEVESITEMTSEQYLALMASVHKVAKRLKEVYQCEKVVTMTFGFDVAHVHVHVVPANAAKEIYEALLYGQNDDEPDFAKLAEVAQRLRI